MKKQWALGNLTSPLNSFTIYAVVRAVGTFARNYVVAYSPRGTGLTKWRKIYGGWNACILFLLRFLLILTCSAYGLNGVISFIRVSRGYCIKLQNAFKKDLNIRALKHIRAKSCLRDSYYALSDYSNRVNRDLPRNEQRIYFRLV